MKSTIVNASEIAAEPGHPWDAAYWIAQHEAEATPQPGWGCCTMCEQFEPDGLVPWGRRERLCWHCTDIQIDLLALACQTPDGLPVEVRRA